VIALLRSVVKVAIPHCRGRWFPITAIRAGSERLGDGCRVNAGFLPNTRVDASRRIEVLGCGFKEMFGADIADS
jgi:hypothetical protein